MSFLLTETGQPLLTETGQPLLTDGTTPPPTTGVHVAGGRLLDTDNNDLGILKGFNVHVAAGVGFEDFVWNQSDYDDMASAGAKLVRHVLHWDVFEQSAGSFHATALASLDTAIARAKTAGMYTLLDAPHLNVGRVPAWAQTEGDEWNDLLVNGQAFIEEIATRYASEDAVIGLNPNEPPVIDLDDLMAGYTTITGWYTSIATDWPIFVSASAYGNGTPSPNTGPQIAEADLVALDVNGTGVVLEWHDYLNLAGTNHADAYQDNGTGDPIQQTDANGSQYHGFGGNYNYPNTTQSRTDFANHIAPHVALRDANSTFALAVGEFGIDCTAGNALQSGDDEFTADKAAAYATAGAVIELWWNYDVTALSSNPWSARPGGTWRPGIVTWLAS